MIRARLLMVLSDNWMILCVYTQMEDYMRTRQMYSVYGTNSEYARSKRFKRHWSFAPRGGTQVSKTRFNSVHRKAQTLRRSNSKFEMISQAWHGGSIFTLQWLLAQLTQPPKKGQENEGKAEHRIETHYHEPPW